MAFKDNAVLVQDIEVDGYQTWLITDHLTVGENGVAHAAASGQIQFICTALCERQTRRRKRNSPKILQTSRLIEHLYHGDCLASVGAIEQTFTACKTRDLHL